MNITPTHIRRRQYVIACRLIALGEQGLYQNFTRLQLRRMAEALPISEKALHKISHQLGYWGGLDVKPIFTRGIILWSNAIIRRDCDYFLCQQIVVE
ncbi:MAG: hypothetical protein AAFO04_28070 [Cyanobacteria bacterium J06592_8]